jgi:large subunit ribosomal protein L24e
MEIDTFQSLLHNPPVQYHYHVIHP